MSVTERPVAVRLMGIMLNAGAALIDILMSVVEAHEPTLVH